MTKSHLWINKIEDEIVKSINLPSNIQNVEFPLRELETLIEETLSTGSISIQIAPGSFRAQDTFLSGLGNNPISIALQVNPLEGDLFWIMPYEDLAKWVFWLKDEDGKAFELENPDLIKGIYKYTLLEVLSILSKTEAYKEFSFRLKEKVKFEQTAYAIDVSLTHNDETIWGRLLLSETFRRSLSNHYATKKMTLSSLKQFKDLSLPLSLRNGSITLSKEELSSLIEGDFLLIDDAYFHPSKGSGSIKVFMNEIPLFLAKPKDDKLKILDYIFSYEEQHV